MAAHSHPQQSVTASHVGEVAAVAAALGLVIALLLSIEPALGVVAGSAIGFAIELTVKTRRNLA